MVLIFVHNKSYVLYSMAPMRAEVLKATLKILLLKKSL